MLRLGVVDFTTQAVNVKGQNNEILKLQVPPTRTYRSIPDSGLVLLLPLRQDFTVTETGGAAKTPTLTLDYPIAQAPSANPIGDDILGFYSTDGSTFVKGTKVTTTPSADGQYQIVSFGNGTIRVYVGANATRYWRFYFRPADGRVSIVVIPSMLSLDESAVSVWERPCASIFRDNQINIYTRPRLGERISWGPRSYFAIKLQMPDKTATQSTETGVTKTVTRQALFIPSTVDPVPWFTETIGLIDIPVVVM